MKVSRAQAEENRERVVEVAAELFRERGIDGVGIAGVMKAAGLTHGGFYGQFGSKEELVSEACGRAAERGLEKWKRIVDRAEGDPFEALVDHYLSERHRDDPATGCVVAALGADAARSGERVRCALAGGVREYLVFLDDLMAEADDAETRTQAIATFAEMVGALVLARAVGDEALSIEILQAVRADLAGREGGA